MFFAGSLAHHPNDFHDEYLRRVELNDGIVVRAQSRDSNRVQTRIGDVS
jgi:hypothetical protein